MRFFADGPSIPDLLLEQCDSRRVVFLCGAGVSIPSNMPDFVDLTKYVVDFFDPPSDSEIIKAFKPWIEGSSNSQSDIKTPLDQIFNLLHQEYGKDEVNALVTERLQASNETTQLGLQHALIKRISVRQPGVPQIVTTNFDRLFELGGSDVITHVPPTFPDLSIGAALDGITYLHGRLSDIGAEQHAYVLSSADFGRAYLSEAWATKFISSLLENYTVVLVGYQAEDPPIKYLLQGLHHDGQFDSFRLYAFDKGRAEDIEAKWRDRGVTSIAYEDHDHLWKTMAEWADRADDPRSWRVSVVNKAQQDPKTLKPHERGQVAHILRTVQGAKLFSEADPPAHPEWLCVMDANIRSAQPNRDREGDSEITDPRVAYGLDDDLKDIAEDDYMPGVINDHLLVWRNEDDNPHDFHRLGGQQVEGFEVLPKRLKYLTNWLSKNIDSPVLAWWAIRQNGMHPRLIKQIEFQVRQSRTLSEHTRHIWNLILEHHRDPRNRQWNLEWIDLKQRIKEEGWSASVLREFRRVTMPRLRINTPYGVRQWMPPFVSWQEVSLSDLGRCDVVFLDQHNEVVDIPNELLPQVFGILEDQLCLASGLLSDIKPIYFPIPSCYRDRDSTQNDESECLTEAENFMIWFTQLFDRIAVAWPELAYARATTWSLSERFFFRKLKLYSFSKERSFESDHVAKAVLYLDQEVFWDSNVARELLFLLVDRWKGFSEERRNQLTDRILKGPDQFSYWSDEEFIVRRNELAARYAHYIELHGCELAADRKEHLVAMIRDIPQWSNDWVISIVNEHGRSYARYIDRDERPDLLLKLPINDVVPMAKAELKRGFDSLVDKRSFKGLVKANPRRALHALKLVAQNKEYPIQLWVFMIDNLPAEIKPRLRELFLSTLARLPYSVVAELGLTLGRWFKDNLLAFIEFNNDLAWNAFDHIVNGILINGEDSSKSCLGETSRGGKVIHRSRRTLDHAINGPVGMFTEALFQALVKEQLQAGSLIPENIKSRIENLLKVPGEGADHAVSIVCKNLNWLMYVDPNWTKENLIPMLAFDHPFSEPAWNGFLHSGRNPWPPLAEVIKPHLLNLFPIIEGFSWNSNRLEIAAQWLGFMRVSHPNEPCGLSQKEMRSVLRAMSDEARNRFIFWLSRVGKTNENGWVKYVIPLVSEDWPRERRYRTTASVNAWICLLDDTGDSFPKVYEAVKKLLVPIEINDHQFNQFIREKGDDKSITAMFPESMLDLMNRVTPQVLTHALYELPKVLDLISEAEPYLTSDLRYLRLIDLVERS